MKNEIKIRKCEIRAGICSEVAWHEKLFAIYATEWMDRIPLFFCSGSDFENTKFNSKAFFEKACFRGNASFRSASFSNRGYLRSASLSDDALFCSAQFSNKADFGHTTFEKAADFKAIVVYLLILKEFRIQKIC